MKCDAPATGPGGNPLGVGKRRLSDKEIAVKGASQIVINKKLPDDYTSNLLSRNA